MSCLAETVSRMKSKLPACFCISSVLRETTTSSAPRRSASSFLPGEDDDVGSERMSKLHARVAQSAETDHANLLALCGAPVAHRGVCRDSRAEQRPGSGEIEVGRNTQDEAFIDNDLIGVATVGHAAEVLVRGVVGERHVGAELLKSSFALGAGTVRVDHAADRSEIAGFVLGNCRADLGDTADDLVPGDNRVDSGHDAAPLVAHLVEIGVADAAEEDLDLHVAFDWIAPRDRGRGKRRCRTRSGVSFGVVHGLNPPPDLLFGPDTALTFSIHSTFCNERLALSRAF